MDAKIAIVLGASIFVFCLLIFLFSFVYKYQRRAIVFIKEKEVMQANFDQTLMQSQIEVQESTYRHIAKELHDNVGQLLSTTKMLMGVTEIKLGSAPDTLNTANATLSKAIQEIRFLSRSLDKEWLQQFNFLENLKSEVDRINMGGTIQAAITVHTEIHLKSDEQIILFRIVQEALQNAIRHAQPAQLNVLIEQNNDLVVKITNDGNPLPINFHGMGTSNMRHRTKLLGGTICWETIRGETMVTISLPLNKNV